MRIDINSGDWRDSQHIIYPVVSSFRPIKVKVLLIRQDVALLVSCVAQHETLWKVRLACVYLYFAINGLSVIRITDKLPRRFSVVKNNYDISIKVVDKS